MDRWNLRPQTRLQRLRAHLGKETVSFAALICFAIAGLITLPGKFASWPFRALGHWLIDPPPPQPPRPQRGRLFLVR